MKLVTDIWRNILFEKTHDSYRKEILSRFPVLRHSQHEYYLALYRYCVAVPERFSSETAYKKYIKWLIHRKSSDEFALQKYMSDNNFRLNSALLFLNEINNFNWHDSFDKLDEYEIMQFLDKNINPTYLRLVEGIFFPFIHLIAFFSRKDRNKDTEKLDVFNCVEEVNNTNLSNLVSTYRNTVRNGIAHGGIKYSKGEILYHDKKGNKEIVSSTQLIRLVDDMVDICNAIALALKIFFLCYAKKNYKIPEQILVEELQAETEAPWWSIIGCLRSEFSGNKQFIIYARPKTRNYRKVFYFSILSGVLAEFFSPGYDRYFVSLRSPKALPGWAALNGKKLSLIRSHGPKSFEDYKGVLEGNLVFYVPKPSLPKFIGKIETMYHSFKINFSLATDDIRKQLSCTKINVRKFEFYRKRLWAFLSGSIILEELGFNFDQERIRKYRKKIIKRVLNKARKNVSPFNLLRYLPLGYARISIFRKDYRKRRLKNFGLGKDLVGTIQINRLKGNAAPDIFGSTVEVFGKYRLAWNSSWLHEREKIKKEDT